MSLGHQIVIKSNVFSNRNAKLMLRTSPGRHAEGDGREDGQVNARDKYWGSCRGHGTAPPACPCTLPRSTATLCTRSVTCTRHWLYLQHQLVATPKQEELHKPAAVVSLAQGVLFAEGTRIGGTASMSWPRISPSHSQLPAASCFVLTASLLHGKPGWSSPHCTLLACAPWKRAFLSLLRSETWGWQPSPPPPTFL